MKTITLAFLVSIVLSGLALASQSGEQKDHHTSMMQEMMKMMNQCGAMMESTHDQGEKAKESQNK